MSSFGSSFLELTVFCLCHRPSRFMDVSLRSFSLCCDLLSRVCHTAVTYCKDALENHLHVIVGTLIPLVDDQMEVQEQVMPKSSSQRREKSFFSRYQFHGIHGL